MTTATFDGTRRVAEQFLNQQRVGRAVFNEKDFNLLFFAIVAPTEACWVKFSVPQSTSRTIYALSFR